MTSGASSVTSEAGMLVFAPTYRSDVTTPEGLAQASQDIVCGYRLARSTASDEARDGELRAATNDAAGERAVQVILAAIAAHQAQARQ